MLTLDEFGRSLRRVCCFAGNIETSRGGGEGAHDHFTERDGGASYIEDELLHQPYFGHMLAALALSA